MEYEYWLSKIRGISARKKCLLREYMKSAEAVYYIEETHLKQLGFFSEKEHSVLMSAKKKVEPGENTGRRVEKGLGLGRGGQLKFPRL